MSTAAMIALYARVSSEQQSKRGTIDSQIAALKERISADGAQIVDDMCFIDAGVSGATLIRPQLERLRDCAAIGTIDQLYILSPDRLARKYAHQALLMEEFSGCGVQVVFLNHAIGTIAGSSGEFRRVWPCLYRPAPQGHVRLVEHRISQVPGESILVPLPCSRTPVGLASLTITACTMLSPQFEK